VLVVLVLRSLTETGSTSVELAEGMANREQLALVRNVQKWNAWRAAYGYEEANLSGASLRDAGLSDADFIRADLFRADLSDANLIGDNLIGANLSNANLSGANLSAANLSAANLIGADLRGADLSGANLSSANLSGANLSNGNLRGANLGGANLSGAKLRDADLAKAMLLETTFANTDLRGTKGLAECKFWGPSGLDHRTIQRSGMLPLQFLRGCGLPDTLIEYLPSLLNDAIQFYSCFISYSTKDQEFADRLYADLQNNGIRSWFAPHNIQGGRKIHEQIDDAIRVYDKLLLILSDASMKSRWVKTEIASARAREEQQNRKMLFPVSIVPFERIRAWSLFDADTGIDNAREIREYFIPDFSNWKDHDSYQAAFGRLLRDLEAETAKPA
jgi:uncharacterized protein YjbI with pentapeptide repeats